MHGESDADGWGYCGDCGGDSDVAGYGYAIERNDEPECDAAVYGECGGNVVGFVWDDFQHRIVYRFGHAWVRVYYSGDSSKRNSIYRDGERYDRIFVRGVHRVALYGVSE